MSIRPVSRTADRETFQLGGIQARLLVTGEDTGNAFAIVEAPIAPKVLAGPLHTHSREDAFWYVVEGQFAAQIGDREIHEGPGLARPSIRIESGGVPSVGARGG